MQASLRPGWWCHLRVTEVDSILGLRWILTTMNFELISQILHQDGASQN